jgi:hypothetical protein
MRSDFEYHTHDPLFVTIYPNTTQAMEALSIFMTANHGSNKVFKFEFAAVKAAIKKAGYSIRKGKKCTQSIDSILAELEA